jgi:hypothetical protein
MPTQLELLLNKPADSTPQEHEEWRANDYFSKGDFDPLFLFVVIPTIIQVLMLGFMLAVFALNDSLF